MPLPFSRPVLLRMLERDMCPRMIAGIPKRKLKQNSAEKMPRIRLATALPSVWASGKAEPGDCPGTSGLLHFEQYVDSPGTLAPQVKQTITGSIYQYEITTATPAGQGSTKHP